MSDDIGENRGVPVVLPAVRVAPLGELRVWIISEDELKQFEQGSPAGLFLNFSLALLSVGISFLAALLSTPIESTRVFTVFVVVCAITTIAGCVLLALWYRSHQQLSKLADTDPASHAPWPRSARGVGFRMTSARRPAP